MKVRDWLSLRRLAFGARGCARLPELMPCSSPPVDPLYVYTHLHSFAPVTRLNLSQYRSLIGRAMNAMHYNTLSLSRLVLIGSGAPEGHHAAGLASNLRYPLHSSDVWTRCVTPSSPPRHPLLSSPPVVRQVPGRCLPPSPSPSAALLHLRFASISVPLGGGSLF